MSELPATELRSGALAAGSDLEALIEALRERGAARFDAVGLRVIEAMMRRAQDCEGATHAALQRKLVRRLAAFRDRFERAGSAARALLARESLRFPVAAEAMRTACESGDYGALERLVARQHLRTDCAPLSELLAYVAHQGVFAAVSEGVASAVPSAVSATGGAPTGVPTYELKSLSHFRRRWLRLSLEQKLSRALAQAPENAGPLNSHFLVLQTLIRMRDIAPSYLEGFMVYADALQWLEQTEPSRGTARGVGQKGTSQKATRNAREKRQKPVRGKAD